MFLEQVEDLGVWVLDFLFCFFFFKSRSTNQHYITISFILISIRGGSKKRISSFGVYSVFLNGQKEAYSQFPFSYFIFLYIAFFAIRKPHVSLLIASHLLLAMPLIGILTNFVQL